MSIIKSEFEIKPRGISIFLILTIFVFAIYYVSANNLDCKKYSRFSYTCLSREYFNSFFFSEYASNEVLPITIDMLLPKYFSEYLQMEGWIIIRWKGQDDIENATNVTFFIYTSTFEENSQDEQGARNCSLPDVFFVKESGVYESSINLLLLQDQQITLPFVILTQKEYPFDPLCPFFVKVKYGNDDSKLVDVQFTEPKKVEINSWQGFRQSAVKNLLLPPWSNIVLPAFTFFVVLWVENKCPDWYIEGYIHKLVTKIKNPFWEKIFNFSRLNFLFYAVISLIALVVIGYCIGFFLLDEQKGSLFWIAVILFLLEFSFPYPSRSTQQGKEDTTSLPTQDQVRDYGEPREKQEDNAQVIASSESSVSQILCPKCGFSVDPEDEKCANCGEYLK